MNEIMDCLELLEKLKNKSMKHFIVVLLDVNGEYEHRARVLIKHPTIEEAQQHAKKIQKSWYNDSKGYWGDGERFRYFNGGEVATFLEEVKEIPKYHYDVMKKYLSVM